MTADAWFYTREGERVGPVTFTDLQAAAGSGQLNPRLDMAWTPTLEAWRPAGEVEGLFERRKIEKPVEAVASTVPVANPYQPPTQNALSEGWTVDHETVGKGRAWFIAMAVVVPLVWGVVKGVIDLLQVEKLMNVAVAINFVVWFLMIWGFWSRLENLGMNRRWVIGHAIFPLNVWIYYRCVACPPDYADHETMDRTGLVLAIVYFLLVFAGLGALLAMFIGIIEVPELDSTFQQTRELADSWFGSKLAK